MFYPVESLKRGGRFYLCWVADSWPLRFTTITHKQLWSQDVRTICDDLMEVISNESGRPVKRFSLRLSSQLMRGLVRLYNKKVNVFLSDLCMLNANVTKHANRKSHDVSEVHRTPRPRVREAEQLPQIVLPEETENEQRIVEIIQNSGNVVSNIQEITLKEATLPEFQLPPNDNFGEENPDQALQLLLGDRTVELMMAAGDPSAQHSGLEALDVTDKSHDRTRLQDRDRDRQMERISEHETTLFRKSNGDELITGGDFEKEIQIPEIPDIVIPEIPILPQEQIPLEPEIIERREEPAPAEQEIPIVPPEPVEIELEELEETEPQPKRRRLRKVIIDKKTKLSSEFLRARIDNPNVELRCEDSSDDIIEIRAPCDVYFRRPCHAGGSLHSNVGLEITRLFMRNLGVVHRSPNADRDWQERMMYRPSPHTRSMLERIEEVEEPVLERPQVQVEQIEGIPENATISEIIAQDLNVSKEVPIDVQKDVDITEMLTQKIDTLSQQARKRKTADENVLTPKKQRSIGYVSFRESQQNRQKEMEITLPIEPEIILLEREADKENVPENMQIIPEITESRPSKEAEKSVTAMLQEAGLADIAITQPDIEPPVPQRRSSKRQGSEGTETPLGSLDRTKVSLGDSEQTTDSKRFIREQWGTEGTMMKLIPMMRTEFRTPINVWSLICKGPLMSGYKTVIAARCFTSLLKLKQHGFIAIKKNPETLEIEDIELGPKFK